MTLTFERKYEQEIEILVPSFWKRKDGVEWTAIIDEATAINFYVSDSLTTIRTSDPEKMKMDIRDAHQTFELSDEVEWIDEYRKVLKSISLEPVITVGSLYHHQD